MRFFYGTAEKEIVAKKMGTAEEHYAWCLSEAYGALKNVQILEEQRIVIDQFERNMQLNQETSSVIRPATDTLSRMKNSSELYKSAYLLELLSGLNIPPQGYLSYSAP